MSMWRLGIGDVDDRGYLFEWSSDPEQHPTIYAERWMRDTGDSPQSVPYNLDGTQTVNVVAERRVMCGKEWMRRNAPKQWAAFGAAQLLGQRCVQLCGDFKDTVYTVAFEDEAFMRGT